MVRTCKSIVSPVLVACQWYVLGGIEYFPVSTIGCHIILLTGISKGIVNIELTVIFSRFEAQ